MGRSRLVGRLGGSSIAGLVVGLVGSLAFFPSTSVADHDQDQHLEETPPPPRLPDALLRRAFPDLEAGLSELPPFIRDTDFNLHFRTFYFGRENTDDSENEAWAIGGWLVSSGGLASAHPPATRARERVTTVILCNACLRLDGAFFGANPTWKPVERKAP